MEKLPKLLERESNVALTENQCLARRTTLSSVLDLYSRGGALRSRDDGSILKLFNSAWTEDAILSLKCLFYLRDIRGGQGERRTFRTILNYLGDAYPEVIKKNLDNIPFYGRWDDLSALEGTKIENDVVTFYARQISMDRESDNPSLAAKWIRSEKSKKYSTFVKKVRKATGLDQAVFRKMISSLRNRINVIEQKLCARTYDVINYESVPSGAMLKYRKAFSRNDKERFSNYLVLVNEGKSKIHSASIFPYEIIRAVERCLYSNDDAMETLNQQWKNLPNYAGNDENALVIVDTSGSMTINNSLPLFTSISLGIYFAERNFGAFKNCFMGFSRVPTMYRLKGNNIHEKYMNVAHVSSFHENTDLIACYTMILNVAKKNNIPEKEMPTRIFMISDMEFDVASEDNSLTAFQVIEKMYADAGYHRPGLVFWNVNSRNDHSPLTYDEARDVFLVSGSSPIIFKHVMESKTIDAIELMLEVLNSERYSRINF